MNNILQIRSSRLLVLIQKEGNCKKCKQSKHCSLVKSYYTIKVYPANPKSIAMIGLDYLKVEELEADVDVISLTDEIIEKCSDEDSMQLEAISPFIEGKSRMYPGYDSCLTEYTFKYCELMETGKLEEALIRNDLHFNICISPLTLLLIEAISLTRKAMKWKEYIPI